jgi:hypothetical protein
MTPHIRQLLAQPDCIRCGAKCYAQHGGRDLRCYHCNTRSIAYLSTVGELTVRVWERQVIL